MRCKMYDHVPIPILNNGYYGELDELIKSKNSFSVIEGYNKQCTEPVTTCNTP